MRIQICAPCEAAQRQVATWLLTYASICIALLRSHTYNHSLARSLAGSLTHLFAGFLICVHDMWSRVCMTVLLRLCVAIAQRTRDECQRTTRMDGAYGIQYK